MFKSLLLSGASSRGIGFLGCLYQLQQNGTFDISQVDTFAGVSVGSMICYLLVIGYLPEQILNALISTKLFPRLHETCNFGKFLSGGVFDYEVINETIQKLTFEKTGRRFLTMRDIRELYSKRLVICAYNETLRKTEYFDSAKAKYDKMSCLVAIRCSSNLPYVFGDFEYNGYDYIDGGISDNIPIHLLDDKIREVLVLTSNLYSYLSADDQSSSSGLRFLSKIINRLQIPIDSLGKRRLEYTSPKVKLIDIDLEKFPLYKFNIDTHDIMEMFNAGMISGNQAPEKWKSERPKQD